MARESISILGIDERPSKRKTIPGLASKLEGLRPDGLKESPQWVPIADIEEFTNASDDPFAHENEADILAMYWHLRSRVGKHGEDGALKRLVILFNDGTVELVDPDKGSGFETVASYAVTSTDSGAWSMSYTQLYDTGYVCVSKGGVPQKDLLIEDDLILEFVFPELPIMRCWLEESEEEYTQEQLDAGEHKGFKEGFVFIRYAYQLRDGTLVMHSAPELIDTIVSRDNGMHRTSYFRFYMEGFQQVNPPTNFEFWKDKISGVSILMSEFNSGDTSFADHLTNSLWYEVSEFDYIDAQDEIEHEDLFRVLDFSEETLASYPIADVDDGSHHIRSHGVCDTYNSRVLLGHERENYAIPFFNQKEGLYNHLVVASDRGLRVIGFPAIGVTVSVENAINMNGVVVYQRDNFQWEIVYTASGAFSCTIKVSATTAKSFLVNIDSSDIDYSAEDKELIVLPISSYTNKVASNSALSRVFNAMVELETETGDFKRISQDRLVYTNADGVWYPQGRVLFYPDIRTKRFSIFANLPLAFGVVMEKLYSSSTRSSEKSNISAIVVKKLTIYSDATSATQSPPNDVNDKTNLVSDKVRASEVNSVLSYNSLLVYRIGRSSTKVTGFAINAQEVSQGQFGQYPLYVFKEDSIWALEQSSSADVVFGRITPIDASLGVANERLITNLGAVVMFATDTGIYMLAGSRAELISDPVRSIVGKVVSLGYRRSVEDRELVVALNTGKLYFYSSKFNRWYAESKSVEFFFSDADKLYAFDANHALLDYQEESGQQVDAEVLLDHIHFGAPDILKRFRFFYARGEINEALDNFSLEVGLDGKSFVSNTKALRPKWKSVYEASLEINATLTPETHYLEEIDTEFEVRYPRKLRKP